MTQEALKLAFEGVEIHSPNSPEYIVCAALIEALREHALREVQRLGQEIEQEPVGYWKEHAQGLQRDYDSLLADFQAQQEERNFCPRCGKRTKDIHTCTPPQENT